jgi:hypothetical protein
VGLIERRVRLVFVALAMGRVFLGMVRILAKSLQYAVKRVLVPSSFPDAR